MLKQRTILHVDFNSFFASCEQQDEPRLRGKPVGVVQDSGKRSVIIGSSKEAKALGIGTGALVWEARRICPQIVIRPARFERYVAYSKLFRKVSSYYSDRIEVFSVDELFMDLTQTAPLFGGGLRVAEEIKRRAKVEVGSWFTLSIGVAPNKMLAKLGSASKKPDGLVVVDPQKRWEFLDQFELWHICGIGPRIERRLKRMGICTPKQLRQAPVESLRKEFGILGEVYSAWGHGEDNSAVVAHEEREAEKSFGNQMTLASPITGEKAVSRFLLNLAWQVAARMREKKMAARTVYLALRGKEVWRGQQLTPGRPMVTAYDLYRVLRRLYKLLGWEGEVRFVGISAGNLVPITGLTVSLLRHDWQEERLSAAWDGIAYKYGAFCLRPARLLTGRVKEETLNGFSKRF